MALSIKSEEADQMARELARLTGETLTDAVTVALGERLARERARRSSTMTDKLRRLVADVGRLPVVDDRTPEEIIGYDAHGLPA